MITALLILSVVAGIVVMCSAVEIGTRLASPAVRDRHPVACVATVIGLGVLGLIGAAFLVVGLAGIVGPVG